MSNFTKLTKRRQNNLIVFKIPETELVDQQNIKTDLLSKFKELITEKCNVTMKTKDSNNRFSGKLETDPKNRPILAKSLNTSLKLKFIKIAFHLKNTCNSIGIDRTMKE